MSVFTQVSHAELKTFLTQYDLGDLLGYQGIGEGVENSNFFVDTEKGRWVLTLFERLNPDDLPYFLGLMAHLAKRGLNCPQPVKARNGDNLFELNERPAAFVTRLRGNNELFPSAGQCAEIGTWLAKMHLNADDFDMSADNTRGVSWRATTAKTLMKKLSEDDQRVLKYHIGQDKKLAWASLPGGPIHADLFRDNALFVGQNLSGVIDFYYACNDAWLYDLAITCNDWCTDTHGEFDAMRARAMIDAYQAIRPFEEVEISLWNEVQQAAALRFWLSRLHDWHFPREGDLVHVKDPKAYLDILNTLREQGSPALIQ